MEKARLYVWKYMKGFFKQRQLKTDSWKWIGFYLGDSCGGSPESGDSMCKIDSKENLTYGEQAWHGCNKGHKIELRKNWKIGKI